MAVDPDPLPDSKRSAIPLAFSSAGLPDASATTVGRTPASSTQHAPKTSVTPGGGLVSCGPVSSVGEPQPDRREAREPQPSVRGRRRSPAAARCRPSLAAAPTAGASRRRHSKHSRQKCLDIYKDALFFHFLITYKPTGIFNCSPPQDRGLRPLKPPALSRFKFHNPPRYIRGSVTVSIPFWWEPGTSALNTTP